MAVVWLARLRGKRGFEKLFAIKTIKTELIHDLRFQEMFLDEARIASGIQHPNVAHILDLGEQDDVLYIVMEWVDGDSLAKIRKLAPKRKTSIPIGITLRVIADTCAGLHAAHQLRDVKGKSLEVVHRDVSPQNILITSAGSVKVIDFGIAKATNRSAGDTRSGIIKGKIHYMAPEQAAGRAIDRRVDIWSVGVCLYELVMGRLPFDGDSDVDVVRRLLADEPAPQPDGSVPAPVAEVISCSLARDPGARFFTAAAMQRALETVMDKLGLQATSEDVAEFLQKHFPDLGDQRRAMVENAIEAAQARDAGAAKGPARDLRANEDVGFAPTILSSEPGSSTSADPDRAAPTRRAGHLARPSPPPAKEESKLTLGSAALEMEEVRGLPKRRGWAWAALVACVGAGGFYGWRTHAVDRVRALLAPPIRTVAAQEPPAVAAPPATHAPIATAQPAVTAPAPVASTSASPTPVASAAAESAGAHPVRGTPSRPAPRTIAPSAAPVAPAPEPAPAPAPSSEEDNPYN